MNWLTRAALALIIIFFCIRNLPWHLDNYDQAKQAYVSFEMIERGNWLYQHTPDGDIATKPPLAGWISAAIYSLTAWWEGAWRLPSLLSALVLLVVLFREGEKISAQVGGLAAAGAFGLNLFTPRLATLVRTDMLLTLCIFLIGLKIFRKIRANARWSMRDRVELSVLLLGSMLIKGPIAYAFLLPGLLAFCWFCRRLKLPFNAWSGWLSWTLPLLGFLAWVGLGIAQSDEFYQQVVLKEFLGRFTMGEEALHKSQPMYFYFANLLHKFAPWSVLLLLLPFAKSCRHTLRKDPALLWLVCWALGGLVMMSLIPSKRPDRIYPVIPPLCLLLAAWLPLAAPGWKWQSRKLLTATLIIALVTTGGYTGYKVARGYSQQTDALVKFGADVRATGIPFAAIKARDEGLLLYLREAEFVDRNDAGNLWLRGLIGGVVIDERTLQKHTGLFRDHRVLIASAKSPDASGQYVFIVRKEFE
jgi:4-amino-4-deoxy-L-arabinose transferase-like glycosyltransferase